MKEVWKPINGYEGMYEVSSFGRVKSLKRKQEVILKAKASNRGYPRVCLCKSGKEKFHSVHRLVAEHFLPENTDAKRTQVNHIDGNKLNNHVSNLEWVTPSENVKHAFEVGIKNHAGVKNNFSKLNDDQAREIYRLAWESGLSQFEIGDKFGIDNTLVSAIKHKKLWKHIHEE